MKIAVVIPFFQREAGILARALASVVDQQLPPGCSVDIVVVDDSSPLPAENELAGVDVPRPFAIELIHRANGGPGAARNTALDALAGRAVDFVAFLDSDDHWLPDHLATAVTALGDDADFYFCDHTRFDTETSWFDERVVFADWRAGRGAFRPAPVEGHPTIYSVAPVPADEAFGAEYLSQTSTVVVRWSAVQALRFDLDLRGAGEDQLFWIDCVQRSRAVRLSTASHVHCGRGVNIYYSSLSWASASSADRYGYLILLFLKMARRRVLSDAMRERAWMAEMAYAYLLLKNATKGRLPNLDIMRKLSAVSVRPLLLLPYRLAQYARSRKRFDWNW